MSNLVEQLYNGTLDFSCVNFDFEHIEIRSKERDISMELIKNLIFHEKMLGYKFNRNNDKECELRYKAPNFLKGRGDIRIRIKLFDNCINVMTVIEDEATASGNRRKYLKESRRLTPEEELEEKAFKKLRHYW